MQQMKEHGKNPQDQTKEWEISSLLEKQFRVIIVKITQNLENKMEMSINRLDAIEINMIQEMFNEGFYHVPSSAAYFSVFSFCLIYCVWGLLSEGWKVTVLNIGVCPPWMGLGQCLVKVSWLGGLVPVF